MLSWFASASEALLLLPIAILASWVARTLVRTMTRRAVRRAQRSEGAWRVRLDRLGDEGQADARKRQRADSVAKMIGRFLTVLIFTFAAFAALELMGVDLAFAISSAGFIGLALALSGQDLVKDFLGGTRALLEDRYAVGDDVILRVGGTDVRGTVDLIGSASVRVRTPEGATWHAGHHAVESVTNLSQLPAVSHIEVPIAERAAADEARAVERLAEASNDIGLTGVVFLRDIETHEPETDPDSEIDVDTVTVRVKTNRPLNTTETQIVRARLLDV
jgi:small-conductance mechanosensitive channel